MSSNVTVNEKKDFIRYYLNHYQLKRRECVWILNYFMSHDSMIEKLHFVDDVSGLDRAVIMSSHCVDEVPFRFYKGNVMVTDAEKAFHDIRLHRDEDLYVQLNTLNLNKLPEYAAVLEDNPKQAKRSYDKDVKAAEQFLNKMTSDFVINSVKAKIDRALDERNKEDFMKYSAELNSLLR